MATKKKQNPLKGLKVDKTYLPPSYYESKKKGRKVTRDKNGKRVEDVG